MIYIITYTLPRSTYKADLDWRVDNDIDFVRRRLGSNQDFIITVRTDDTEIRALIALKYKIIRELKL